MGMTAAQYLSAMKSLLPPGAAWPRGEGTVLHSTLAALSEEFARIDARAHDLLEEADPRTTLEMLTDWERVAGLPDACLDALETIQERRAALVAKLVGLGGQSRQHYVDLCATIGYPVTITEFERFRVGVNRMGDRLYGQPWVYAWQVNAPAVTIKNFLVGQSACGDALRSWGNQLLECLIKRTKPAHTLALVTYSEAAPGDDELGNVLILEDGSPLVMEDSSPIQLG